MVFQDREEAGQRLAQALKDTGGSFRDGVVLAVPRGGVVVGAQVARELGLPLDLIIPRKIGAPHNPEAAVGAVAQDGTAIFDRHILNVLRLREEDLEADIEREVAEIRRRMKKYRGKEDYPPYDGKKIILVDDGVATGYTILAAIRSVKNMFHPAELVLAIPVAPPDTLTMLKKEVDRAICLLTPANFYAVGQFYVDFGQTADEEVIVLLREFARPGGEN